MQSRSYIRPSALTSPHACIVLKIKAVPLLYAFVDGKQVSELQVGGDPSTLKTGITDSSAQA